MGSRLELHDVLLSILASDNVYFQPPASLKMLYPCIVYNRSSIDIKKADNMNYKYTLGYTVTYIDPNPDGLIVEKLLSLPMCSYSTNFKKDNLNHDVFNIYY